MIGQQYYWGIMHRFFLQKDLSKFDEISLNKNLSHQILRVLRMNAGDKFELFNNTKNFFLAEIKSTKKNEINCKIIKEFINDQKYLEINVFQSIVKSPKMEIIIEKLTEIGISTFTPIITERTQKKDINSLSKNKLDRLKKISIESSEQSGKTHIPIINNKININQVDFNGTDNVNIIFYEEIEGSIKIDQIDKKLFKDKPVAVFIGPVGGFSQNEIEYFKKQKSVVVNLGNTVFKSDTAAIISVSLLKYVIDKDFN